MPHNFNLLDLKNLFHSDINSVRQFDRIKTFDDLVAVLYDRDVFQYFVDDNPTSITTEDLIFISELKKIGLHCKCLYLFTSKPTFT